MSTRSFNSSLLRWRYVVSLLELSLVVVISASADCLIADTRVITVDLATNDIVYDRFSDLIYASVPSILGPGRGNTITPIDPRTGEMGVSAFVTSDPTLLALADDGSRLFVASDSTNRVTPFSLTTMSPQAFFVIGGADRRVSDMEVAPGSPETLAVSLRRLNSSIAVHFS